jgi:hypothetical protein
MNNGLRQAYEPEPDDADLGEHSRLGHHAAAAKVVASVCLSAKARISAAVPPAIERASGELKQSDVRISGTLDRGIVSGSFFPKASKDGITLVELCAGIGAGLEAALLSGIKVNKYVYVDIDPLARDIARFRVANLSARSRNYSHPRRGSMRLTSHRTSMPYVTIR